MKIERIELRHIHMPYVRPFETSGWRHESSDAIIVRVDADGITGWGESPVSDGPWYNEEDLSHRLDHAERVPRADALGSRYL